MPICSRQQYQYAMKVCRDIKDVSIFLSKHKYGEKKKTRLACLNHALHSARGVSQFPVKKIYMLMSASCKYVTSTRHCIIVEAYKPSDRAI